MPYVPVSPWGPRTARTLGETDFIPPAALGVAASDPKPPLPDTATVRAQAKAAADQFLVKGFERSEVEVVPGWGDALSVDRTNLGWSEAALISYWDRFDQHYHARIQWDLRQMPKAKAMSILGSSGRTADGTLFYSTIASEAGDDEMATVVAIWGKPSGTAIASIKSPEVTGWLPTVTEWVKWGSLGGLALLGLLAINVLLPRD